MKHAHIILLHAIAYIGTVVWATLDAEHANGCGSGLVIPFYAGVLLVTWLVMPKFMRRWILDE
jgi:hypothetical protein